ncbi:uncharacterized protein TNCV_4608081 [Trichonephila clavipes]|nr:uncharacterized protein TNCV_4608081 [Trichonephila clavipes]
MRRAGWSMHQISADVHINVFTAHRLSSFILTQSIVTVQRYVDKVLRPLTLSFLRVVPNAAFHCLGLPEYRSSDEDNNWLETYPHFHTIPTHILFRFVEWAQNEISIVPDFHKRILFSDEAHFWLNGYVNKQNCRIWSEANPQVYVETPLLPEKLTVWCALWAGGILQKR